MQQGCTQGGYTPCMHTSASLGVHDWVHGPRLGCRLDSVHIQLYTETVSPRHESQITSKQVSRDEAARRVETDLASTDCLGSVSLCLTSASASHRPQSN